MVLKLLKQIMEGFFLAVPVVGPSSRNRAPEVVSEAPAEYVFTFRKATEMPVNAQNSTKFI